MAKRNFSSADDRLSLFNYDPNLPAAVLGIIGFAAAAMVRLWQFSRNWPWYFWAMNAGIAGSILISSDPSAKLMGKQWKLSDSQLESYQSQNPGTNMPFSLAILPSCNTPSSVPQFCIK
ncbi:hypothetical protein J1614_011084 [Plenodomus biglobosus]|nr:hypothetical protein J1614_011084 [Plenodomus biglobosus]